ncbi:hypothetical protein [Sphingomonas sp.]|uniref:hypothetical protein n=1 Tax=Sphingomonas sp. TaxID=28214 RepID=UPI003B3B5702
MTLSPVLARELAAARPRFNAQVSEARRARTGFDLDALTDAVRERIDPLAVAVEAAAPDRAAAVVDAAFALTLDLVGRGLAGTRRALIDRVWAQLAPALATTVAQRPEPVLAMLTNAALTIDATAGARAEAWITHMAELGPLIDADTLPRVGQVVAWRSGMAHYRAQALAAADALPEPLALAAIGAVGSWREARAALAADRWWTPDGRPAAPIRVGGFVGFGGPFERPPRLKAGADGFIVRSGAQIFLLIADAWGATLHPASDAEYDAAEPATAAPGVATNLATDRLVAARTRDSVALASPYSHFVEVQPWRP